MRNTIYALPAVASSCYYHPRSPTDIQRGQVVGALSSLKRFGQGPSWSPVFTVSQSASIKDALVQDCLNLRQHVREEVAKTRHINDRLLNLSDSMACRLLNSKSDSTSQNYLYSYKKYEAFLRCNDIPLDSASPIHVALYITDLLDKGASYSVVCSVAYAIKWVCELKNLSNPCDNAFVKNLIESAKRSVHKPVNKKDPVSVDMLIQLCKIHQNSTDLLTIRRLYMILLGFSGFLRFNEIANLKCNDVNLYDSYFSLKIRKSKTDQYRQGDEVVISRGQSVACPYDMLVRYISLGSIDVKSEHFLFKPIFRTKTLCKLIYKDKPLSYTSTRENILKALAPVADDLKLGLHSLRSGGATAVANTGVSDRNWKRHGRWKSDSSKDGYVVDSLGSRLEVSQKLGL
ncbi:hypothetical protein FSP39_005994 [Pinctada imbricata]|uniref:Tyr recombinase domain-containing protein n=1 Tax=Pinctada imbricata TaxID=66713 RepID=A0AA88Y9C5_PINIB|nr:hypothetical protein FSP39_005994 [Pinctada imbricata]